MKRLPPFYPYFFSLYSLFFYTGHHMDSVTWGAFLTTLVLVFVLTTLLWLILFPIKDRKKRAFLVSVLILLFLSYRTIQASFTEKYTNIWPWLAGCIVLAAVIWVWRSSRFWESITRLLQATSIFLLLLGLLTIIEAPHDTAKANQVPTPSVPKLQTGKQTPDIYYLVFDEYTGPTGLNKLYHYDDTSFLDGLRQQGFYIADKSTSNYYGSLHSLAATLNLNYFDSFGAHAKTEAAGQAILHHLVEDNAAVLALKQVGYHYYHLGSWWDQTRTNKNADYNLNAVPPALLLPSFSLHYISDNSILGPAIDTYYPQSDHTIAEYQIQKIETIAANDDHPKFIFAHFMLPHAPNIYDKNCNPLTPHEIANNKGIQAYTDQVTCTNKKITELLKTILTTSKTPPIIIVQSDEGQEVAAEEPADTNQWSDNAYLEKFPTLSAFYFPDKNYHDLYPTITSVNSFRYIFSHYLGANLPLLPDKNYMMPDYWSVSGQIESTDRVKRLMQ